MITILFAPTGIAPGGLDVSIWRPANPDVTPSRKNRQPPNAFEPLFVTNRFSIRIEIFEGLPVRLARVTGLSVAYITQPSFLSSFDWIGAILRIDNLSLLFANVLCRGVHVIEFASRNWSGGLDRRLN